MHAVKKGRRLEKKIFELKSKGYRDGIKRKDTRYVRMALHLMGLLSVQCLQVDEVLPC